MHANVDKLDNYEIDDDDGIIAVGDIPQQPPHAPLLVNNTEVNNATGSGDDNEDNDDEDDKDSSDDNNNDKPAAATDVLEGNKSDSNRSAKIATQRKGHH